MQSARLPVELGLFQKYAVAGPRYTSYPTAPTFEATFDWREYLRAIVKSNAARRPLSLYVHLPYCRSLCWYCGCNRAVTSRRETIRKYLAHLKKEIGIIVERLDEDRPVVQLHWGGGSPSYLTSTERADLMRFLKERFHLKRDAEIGIELDPRDVQPGDAETLAAAGFNRISLGVQDLDPSVQESVNRVHAYEHVREVLGQLRRAGFSSINLDLMYGLPKQNLFTFTDTIAKIVSLNPDRIALFNFAYLPNMFKHQRLIRAADLPTADEKLDILKACIETLTGRGYVYIGMDHFAKPTDELCIAQKNKTLYRNFQGYSTRAGCDLFGFGSSAIGQVHDSYAQNTREVPDYLGAIGRGLPATTRGRRLCRDDQIRREVIQQIMCNLELDKGRLEEDWDIDLDRYFAAELEELKTMEDDGLVKTMTNGLRVTDTGRLFIRNIAMIFDRYLRQRQDRQYVYSRTV